MKKQIIYPRFIPRVFAMTLDLVILSIVLTPIMNYISQYVFIFFFHDYLTANNINIFDQDAITVAVRTKEFADQVKAGQFFGYFGTIFTINTLGMAAYFVTFWHKLGATPGKIFMRMKVVDAATFNKPSLYNSIKRFFGYITIIIGIWSMAFSKNGMATHDKIANTIVIKN
ncbi:MAG: RDD family protein [Rickettsiales bacterium]|nr:RDD family protein [Rickettsiales bacterium]MCA0254937.1 RDD family protein [Pseudomonadota bacterium]